MTCPRCRRRYVRSRRDKVACRSCCDTYAGGNYDRRFRLAVTSRAE
jgi:ribosomal protein L37AE/L43A